MSDSTARCVEELTDSQSDSTPLRCEAAQHLNEEDFRSLEASSWIDRQTATLAGLRRVDSLAAAEMLRRSDGARRDYAGILFPYVLPGRQHPHSYRIRRDHPEYEVGTDGQPKQINKYLSASGTQNRLYFTPGTRSEDLADIDLPLIIVEGEKKALSLFRLAKHSADPRRFLAVGIAGAWNWRGVNGKTVNEKGERVNTHGAIPDLGLLHLSGRLVLVAFDADCRTNDHVASARTGLIKELRRRGARTRTFEIPETSGTKGIDELLVKWGPNKVEDLMREAFNSSDATSTHYRSHGNCLWRTTSTRDGVSEIQLTNFDAVIVSQVVEDNGCEQRWSFEIHAVDSSQQRHVFTLSAQEFVLMNWPITKIGPRAIVFPHQKEHARAAIQALSENPHKKTVFTHIGWTDFGGQWIYLHARGAIGAYGNVPGLEVRVDHSLNNYELQLPGCFHRIRAIQSSLSLLKLAPKITPLLLAAVYRAALGPCDFIVHLAGPSGVYKTSLAALLQQHFGAGMHDRNLPGSWSSTANALEVLAFQVKDSLLVVDDYAPAGDQHDVNKLQITADRLIRATGNLSSRRRLTTEGVLQGGKPPRGLVLSTGEDIPRGHSIAARLLILEIEKGDVDVPLLTRLQVEAREGGLCESMASFVQHVAKDFPGVLAKLEQRVLAIRDELGTAAHARTPGILAHLIIGFETFLAFALEVQAIDQRTYEEHREDCRRAAIAALLDQVADQKVCEPTAVYFGLLRTAIASGRAYFADANTGDVPADASAWGWRRDTQQARWKPLGVHIGWVGQGCLFIDPNAAYLAAKDVAKVTGETLPIAKRTLHKRLNERGLLLTTDATRKTYSVRKRVDGIHREVLHVRMASLIGDGISTPDRTDMIES